MMTFFMGASLGGSSRLHYIIRKYLSSGAGRRPLRQRWESCIREEGVIPAAGSGVIEATGRIVAERLAAKILVYIRIEPKNG
jgi:hypothetical protein